MTKVRKNQPILPSLLDRLIDEDPDSLVVGIKKQAAVLSDIKESVRRDLECLLNTRLSRYLLPEEMSELEVSIVNYGVPDFSLIQLSSDDGRENFKDGIQKIIKNFEPRFRKVHVTLNDMGEKYDRTLYLKISALLMVEPNPIPLLFDSRVKLMDKTMRLREVNYG